MAWPKGKPRGRNDAMTTTERTTRAQEQRSNESIHDVHDDTWEEYGVLTAPPPRPGFVQRWVASKRSGQDAVTNLMRKANNGWRPRAWDSVPESQRHLAPAMKHETYGNIVAIEGMILMERREETHERATRSIREQTKAQSAAIRENIIQANNLNRGMGITSIEVSRSVSRGRPVNVADDD